MQSNIHLPSFIQCIHTLLDLPTDETSPDTAAAAAQHAPAGRGRPASPHTGRTESDRGNDKGNYEDA